MKPNDIININSMMTESTQTVKEANPHNFDSDEDFYAAQNAPAKRRSAPRDYPYTQQQDDEYFNDIFRKKREAAKKAAQDNDKDVTEAEGTPSGMEHLDREVIKHIIQQTGTEGAHAIIKSLGWGDGAAKELLALIVKDLKQDIGMDKGVAEAKASSASFRSGNKKRADLNAMSDEERRAYDTEQQEKQRKRDDARLERERQKNAAKKGVAEATGDAKFDAMMGNITNQVATNKTTDFGTPYQQTGPGVVAKALRGALMGIMNREIRMHLQEVIDQLRNRDVEGARETWQESFTDDGTDMKILKLAKKAFPYIDVVGFFENQGMAEGSLTDTQQSYWDQVAKEKKNKGRGSLKAKKAEYEKTPIGKAEKYWGQKGVAEGSYQKKPMTTHTSDCGHNYGHDCDCDGTLTHNSDCHYNYGHDCDCGLSQQKQNNRPRGGYSDEEHPIKDDGNEGMPGKRNYPGMKESPDYSAMYDHKLMEMGAGSVATAPGVGTGPKVGSLFGGSYSQKNSPFKKNKPKKSGMIKR